MIVTLHRFAEQGAAELGIGEPSADKERMGTRRGSPAWPCGPLAGALFFVPSGCEFYVQQPPGTLRYLSLLLERKKIFFFSVFV